MFIEKVYDQALIKQYILQTNFLLLRIITIISSKHKYKLFNHSRRDVACHGTSLQLKVYDVLGKEVATLVNEQQAVGDFEISNSVFIENGDCDGLFGCAPIS